MTINAFHRTARKKYAPRPMFTHERRLFTEMRSPPKHSHRRRCLTIPTLSGSAPRITHARTKLTYGIITGSCFLRRIHIDENRHRIAQAQPELMQTKIRTKGSPGSHPRRDRLYNPIHHHRMHRGWIRSKARCMPKLHQLRCYH